MRHDGNRRLTGPTGIASSAPRASILFHLRCHPGTHIFRHTAPWEREDNLCQSSGERRADHDPSAQFSSPIGFANKQRCPSSVDNRLSISVASISHCQLLRAATDEIVLRSGMVDNTHLFDLITNYIQIVEKDSALLDVEHEEQIPTDANHSAMCKFEADSDDTFEKVYKRIRRMRTDPRPRATDQTSTSR